MIKANELRISNFIVDDDGALSKVIGFKPYEHSVRCDEEEGCDILIDIHGADGKIRRGYAVESTEANPIPLTHEWLKKCALIDKNVFFPGEPTITSKGSLLIQCINDTAATFYLPINNSIEIKYLHQLQNLYHALTGEELQIKMP